VLPQFPGVDFWWFVKFSGVFPTEIGQNSVTEAFLDDFLGGFCRRRMFPMPVFALAGCLGLLQCPPMALPDNSDSGTKPELTIDEKKTFAVLISCARRKLLVALANGGAQTGADLIPHGRAYGKCSSRQNLLDSTLKNLKPMVEAGLVLKQDHPTDGRLVLYRLSPAIIVTHEGSDTVLNFGFCRARLSADGN
jgi:hypothetical protein